MVIKSIYCILVMEYSIGGDSILKIKFDTKKITSDEFILGCREFPTGTDSTVQPEHIKIYRNDGKWYADALAEYGSYIKITPALPTKVKYGTFIVFGKTWMCTKNINDIFFCDENYLSFANFKPIINKQYTITKECKETKEGVISIAKDNTISSNHAKVTFLEDAIEVIDWKDGCGSTNGTYYSISSNFELPERCIIRIGLNTWIELKILPSVVQSTTTKLAPSQGPLASIPRNKLPTVVVPPIIASLKANDICSSNPTPILPHTFKASNEIRPSLYDPSQKSVSLPGNSESVIYPSTVKTSIEPSID